MKLLVLLSILLVGVLLLGCTNTKNDEKTATSAAAPSQQETAPSTQESPSQATTSVSNPNPTTQPSAQQEPSISADAILLPSQSLLSQQDLSEEWQAKDSWGKPLYVLETTTAKSQCDNIYVPICASGKNNEVVSCSGTYCYDPGKETPNSVTLSGRFADLKLDFPDDVIATMRSNSESLTKNVNLAAASFTPNPASLTTTQTYSVGGQRNKRITISVTYYASVSEAQKAFQKELADAKQGKTKLDFDKPVGNERFGAQKVIDGSYYGTFCQGTEYVFRRNNVLFSGEIGIPASGCPDDSDKNELVGYLRTMDARLIAR